MSEFGTANIFIEIHIVTWLRTEAKIKFWSTAPLNIHQLQHTITTSTANQIAELVTECSGCEPLRVCDTKEVHGKRNSRTNRWNGIWRFANFIPFSEFLENPNRDPPAFDFSWTIKVVLPYFMRVCEGIWNLSVTTEAFLINTRRRQKHFFLCLNSERRF